MRGGTLGRGAGAIAALVLLIAPATSSGAADYRWWAADLHVHTCFSHDVYCPTAGDDNTGPDELYTLGSSVSLRFFEAKQRGLDYLAITDHNDIRSQYHPAWPNNMYAQPPLALPGYENSLDGHAQMLGATKIYNAGDKSAEAVNAMAAALRADGGMFQINHPLNGAKFDGNCESPELDWGYGTDVVPDAVEVWNSAEFQLRESLAYWERCWLDRGYEVAATGGSDSHWLATTAIQGVGNPTTWIGSSRWPGPYPASVLSFVKGGRTSITRLPPSSGGAPLNIQADLNGDGVYEEAGLGWEVPPGTKLQVSVAGDHVAGMVRVRANGETIVNGELLGPNGVVRFTAPSEPGWVRAELWAPGTAAIPDVCDGIDTDPTVCPNDLGMLALTSPLYLR